MSFDDFFGDFDAFSSNFMKRIQRMMNELDKATKNGDLKGKWAINQIDRPGVKGYIIQGHFGSDQPLGPLDPFDPFEPLNPMRRRPVPRRPFEVPESALKETREPLTDIFEEEKAIKIYVEVPGEEKDDIQLNVTAGKVEVKAKNFYKMINLPTSSIDLEKASSKYKNGVLKVTIPKKEKTLKNDTHKINID
ncbi:Hsp20/alpha crystallin family protein [Candidatus Bathyarchaeota archaeon]|nr:Hsp20/alpha crystallin family protein [Candidatus Bathyarchaeota archaeon]